MLKQAMTRSVGRLAGQVAWVSEAAWISPAVRRVRLAGPQLKELDFTPGDKVKLHVGEGIMRSYTPARYWPDAGVMDLIFHVHGGGRASDWAAQAEPGEETFLFGPVPSVSPPRVEASRLLLLGDETTLGLFLALDEAHEGEVFGAVELAEADLGAVEALGLPLTALPRAGAHGEALTAWLRARRPSATDTQAVLSGEATSVLGARDALLEAGWTRPQLRAKPYWSARGKAHRKRLERGALRS